MYMNKITPSVAKYHWKSLNTACLYLPTKQELIKYQKFLRKQMRNIFIKLKVHNY